MHAGPDRDGRRPLQRAFAGRPTTLNKVLSSLSSSYHRPMDLAATRTPSSVCASHRRAARLSGVFFPKPFSRPLALSDHILRLQTPSRRWSSRGAGRLLPRYTSSSALTYAARRFASTRIEGTQASLIDLFDAERATSPSTPTSRSFNYVRAMETGLQRLTTLPVSVRLSARCTRSSSRWSEPRPPARRTGARRITDRPPRNDRERHLLPPTSRANWARCSPISNASSTRSHDCRRWWRPLSSTTSSRRSTRSSTATAAGPPAHVFLLVVRNRLPEPLLYLSPYFEQRRQEY